MKRLAARLVLGLASILAQAAPYQIVDDRGVRVELPAPPRRIVSLLPSLTESVCALAACDRLVGVDRYASWPASVQHLQRLGGGIDPDVEAIARLQPDLVLLAQSSRAIERLHALGLTVVVLEPRTHEEVHSVLLRLGVLLDGAAGRARAAQVWRAIEDALDRTAQALPPAARGLRVYFEVGQAPWAASAGSFIGQTLARLGAHNIVPASLGPFPKLNPEFVVRADPQRIMLGAGRAGELARRPGWSAIDAVRQHHICRYSADEMDVLLRAGPRLAEGAALMARCLALP